MAEKILVVHGPNLNLLGRREPTVYGRVSLEDINRSLIAKAQAVSVSLDTFQSNAEHELIDRIQETMNDGTDFIIINPAALTHTSIALRDALAATNLPFIEVHLSNIYAREHFRHTSCFSDIAAGVISGLGAAGYELALQFALTGK